MADIKTKYPASSANSTALTISLASLASDSNRLAGRESTVVDNTTNLDLDHLVSGKIRTGTSPTVSKVIEVYAYSVSKIATGTPTYVDAFTGSDANKSVTSANVRASALRLVWSTQVDATSDRDYYIPPTSIASLFGELPAYWGLWVVHDTAVNLNSTAGNHELHYHRVQRQTV